MKPAKGPTFLPPEPVACSADPLLFAEKGVHETPERFDLRVRQARVLCYRCPVLAQCRDWSLRNLVSGVTGGLTDKERAETRRRLGMPPPAGEYETPEQTTKRLNRAMVPQLTRAGMDAREISARLSIQRRQVERLKQRAGVQWSQLPIPPEIRVRNRRRRHRAQGAPPCRV